LACYIGPFLEVNLIACAPPQIRVMGTAGGCPGNAVAVEVRDAANNLISGPSPGGPATVDPATLRYTATLPVIGSGVKCGDQVTVKAWCVQDPTCSRQDPEVLDCCAVTITRVEGQVPAGSLDPNAIVVVGTLLGCCGDQVVVSSPGIGQSSPTGINPLTGEFRATIAVPSTSTIKCCQRIQVDAWCAQDPNCTTTRRLELDCPACMRATVSQTQAAACVGNTRDVTLNATVNVPIGQTQAFRWIYDHPKPPFGSSNVGPIYGVTNSTTDCNTPFTLPPDTYSYPPGTYTALLVLVNPGECPSPTAVPLTFTVQCPPPCPTATITYTVDPGCVNGKRKVTVQATVTAPTGGAAGQWLFDTVNGKSFGVPSGATQGPATNPDLEDSLDLPPGNHTVSLKWNLPSGCPSATLPITVPDCPYHCDVTVNYQPKPAPCLPTAGSVKLDFTATLIQPNPGYTGPFTWEVKDPAGTTIWSQQQSQPAFANPEQFSYTFTTAGTYTVGVSVQTDGQKCKDSKGNPKTLASDSVAVPIVGCCPSGKLIAKPLSSCQWYFEADVTNPSNLPLTFDWSFHDGATAQTTSNYTTHTFAPGSVSTGTAQVTVKAAGCPDLVLTATVSHSCGACPTVGTPTASVTGCAPGSAAVTLSTNVAPPVATSIDWTVTTPAGTSFTKTTTATSTTDGTGDGPWTDSSSGSTGPLDLSAPGSYAVSVNAKGPAIDPSCPAPPPSSFTVPPCPTTGTGEGFGCRLLRWLAVILLSLAGVAFIIAFCAFAPPLCTAPGCANLQQVFIGIGIGLALAGLIALGLWLLLCPTKPCAWGWLLAGQVLLGVGTFALYFAPCCPALWIIGGILVLAAIFCFWRWVTLCKVGLCPLAAEILIVLATVVVPIVATLVGLPIVGAAIAACVSKIVGAVVGIVVAILSAIVANCILSGTST
jgi:hypothetical protein